MTVSQRPFLSLSLPLVLLAGGETLWARTYELRPTMPETEFNKIANALQPGDELVFHGGTYSQNSRRAVTAKGTRERPIIIRAAAGEQPLLLRREEQRDRQNNIESSIALIWSFEDCVFRAAVQECVSSGAITSPLKTARSLKRATMP